MPKPNSKEPHLTAGTQKFVNGLEAAGGPPLYTLTPQQARGVLNKAQSGPVKLPEVEKEDLEIPAGPNGKTPVRIIRPAKHKGPLPFVLYIHGAGWVMGNKETHDRMVCELADRSGRAIVYPDYSLSPEAHFPIAIEQSYATLKYMVENGAGHSLSADEPIVSGDSVGGNMSLAVALMAKQRREVAITALVLFYPVTDARMNTESYEDFADGPWLTQKAMEWFWDAYLPDKSKRSDPLVSPLQASMEELEGLPPTLIMTGENDVLRDEGEAMAVRLDEAGVPVTSIRFNGTIHDFAMLNDLADTGQARTSITLAAAAIREAGPTKN